MGERQIIRTESGEELVVIPRADYEAMQEALEDASDLAFIAEHRDEPSIPMEDFVAIARGELHPLAAWRKAAGLTQAELAEKAGVRTATVSDIERGADARLDTMRRLAAALGLAIDDIAPFANRNPDDLRR